MNRLPILGIVLAALFGAGTFLLTQRTGQVSATAAPVASLDERPAGADVIEVWKSPTCGCCSKWVEHLQAAGFTVAVNDVQDLASVKARLGVPASLGSCHTAQVDGYVVEGHVPAADIRRLLSERPDVGGLAVPGMPTGSPGMEMGDRKDPYDVLTFTSDGSTAVYSEH